MQVEPTAENSFIDTADPEVLKALHVGVTIGLSASEFGLDALFTREAGGPERRPPSENLGG